MSRADARKCLLAVVDRNLRRYFDGGRVDQRLVEVVDKAMQKHDRLRRQGSPRSGQSA
jgi:hypothetical protein